MKTNNIKSKEMKTKLTKDEIRSLANIITLKIKKQYKEEFDSEMNKPEVKKMKKVWAESMEKIKKSLDDVETLKQKLVEKNGVDFKKFLNMQGMYRFNMQHFSNIYVDNNNSDYNFDYYIYTQTPLLDNIKNKYKNIIMHNPYNTYSMIDVVPGYNKRIADFITVENFENKTDATLLEKKVFDNINLI